MREGRETLREQVAYIAVTVSVLVAVAITAPPVAAQSNHGHPDAVSATQPPTSSRRTADAPAARTWIRIDPQTDELHAYELEPRGDEDRARLESFVARHPELAGAGAER